MSEFYSHQGPVWMLKEAGLALAVRELTKDLGHPLFQSKIMDVHIFRSTVRREKQKLAGR
jgi:hypothetical protein